MKTMMFNNLPTFIKKEIDELMSSLQPYMKKFSKYRLFAIPLIVFPIMNLLMLLFTGGWYMDAVPTLSIYAVMGAIGIALFKESKYVKKEIESLSMKQMIERINKSAHINENTKNKYIEVIKSQPKFSFQAFLEFLKEEHDRKSVLDN